MTITPFLLGVFCTLAAEAILTIVVASVGYLIDKLNAGKAAMAAMDALTELAERKNDGRTNE